MDPAFTAVFREYAEREQREHAARVAAKTQQPLAVRNEMLLGIGEDTGRLLNILIKASRARSILEIGTSFGYSTLWLAEAARAVGGRVVTLELAPQKVAFARERMRAAGLIDWIDFRVGDALASLASLDMKFDFVLLDPWKELYVPCLELFYPRLNPGALIAADNMLLPEYSRPDAAKYIAAVRSLPGIESVTVPVGSGVELSRWSARPPEP
ncbi:MAG TPA: class I SAM-dependent methyltransferase [Steroidobacteraceae bacterium]|nr:class I SAM-dependent methyltransferase [Steroidobacteraceae bacterium]